MENKALCLTSAFLATATALILAGCGNAHAADPAAGLPPDAKVVPFGDAALFSVDHPSNFRWLLLPSIPRSLSWLLREQSPLTSRGRCQCPRSPPGESWRSTRAWAIR